MSGVLHDPKGELTEAPELPDVVAFNIADGAFEFFGEDITGVDYAWDVCN